jgi:hypothetical protein
MYAYIGLVFFSWLVDLLLGKVFGLAVDLIQSWRVGVGVCVPSLGAGIFFDS